MKVTLYYEDTTNKEYYKTLRITLPKSWKNGPIEKLLGQFIETYNATAVIGEVNPLQINEMHLAIRSSSSLEQQTQSVSSSSTPQPHYKPLAKDAIINTVLSDRMDIYVRHGVSKTVAEMEDDERVRKQQQKEIRMRTVNCIRLGCQHRFSRGGPYPGPCIYHQSPPVFHETAKFWSCCPHKKAYDFDEFQNIPGCQTAEFCTDNKEESNGTTTTKSTFLGGMDLRESTATAVKLKSIDEFNKQQQKGGGGGGDDTTTTTKSLSSSVLEQFKSIMVNEFGMDIELYNQVIDGITNDIIKENPTINSSSDDNTTELQNQIQHRIANLIKDKFKDFAAQQLRIR